MTKIITDSRKLGKFLMFLMLHFQNFTNLMNIWHLMGWLYLSKGKLYLSSISCKLSDTTGYTYDMEEYAEKYGEHATRDMTVTHAPQLTRWVKGCGHKLYMDSYFSSPDLYINLKKQKINSCCTIRLNHKGMPDNFRGKIQKLKLNDVRVRSSGDMTAVVCKDKCAMHMLSNIHDPPAEGNLWGDWKCPEASHYGGLQLTWVKSTNVTEWPAPPVSLAICGNGQRNWSFVSLTS